MTTSSASSAFGFSIPGQPEYARKARVELAGFLAAAGLPAAVVDDAVLASCELVNNALMHTASGLVGGEVSVQATVSPQGRLQVDVSDQGPIPTGQARSEHQARLPGEGGYGRTVVTSLSAGQAGEYTLPGGRHVAWFRLDAGGGDGAPTFPSNMTETS